MLFYVSMSLALNFLSVFILFVGLPSYLFLNYFHYS